MSGLTFATSGAYIDDSFGTSVRTAPTTPMKLAAESVASTASAAGTELANTTRPSISMAASTGTPPVASNSAAVTVVVGSGNSAVSVVSQSIWDSAATPVRKWWGPLAASRTVNSGDSLAFAIGAITASISS